MRYSLLPCPLYRRALLSLLLLVASAGSALLPARSLCAATHVELVGPPGSGAFGTSVTALTNGNIVVTDPQFDLPGVEDVGAVYLYDGVTGALISTLTGSSPADAVGYSGVAVLSNGNYLVRSPYWHNGTVALAGAVTFGNAET